MRRRSIEFLIATLFLSPTQLFAQRASDRAEIEHWAQITRIAIQDVRAKLRPTLSGDDRVIVDTVEFSVDPTIAFAGQARRQGSHRTIVVSAGVGYIMNVLGQSLAVGFRGNVACMQTHMFRSIKDAVEGMAPEPPPGGRQRVWPMAAFARIEPVCKGADRLIQDDAQMKQAIGATTRIGLSLVILHEIAHQVLGHVDESPCSAPGSPHHIDLPTCTPEQLEQSRKNEDAADRWAMEKAIILKEPFELAMPYMMFMTATTLNNVTLEGEKSSTHPSGPRRALVLLDELEDDLQDKGMSNDMLESAEKTREQLKRLLRR